MHAVIQSRYEYPRDVISTVLVVFSCLFCAPVLAEEAPAADKDFSRQGLCLLLSESSDQSSDHPRIENLLKKKLRAIEAGTDVNSAAFHKQTALMYAAASNDFFAVCWLVAKGADVRLVSEKRKRARDYATDERIRKLLRIVAEDESAQNESASLPFPAGSAECLALRVRRASQTAEGASPVQMTADMAGEELILALALRLPHGDFPPAQQLASALLQGELPVVSSLLQEHPQLLHDHDLLRYARSADAVRTLMDAGMNPEETWRATNQSGQDTLSLLVPALHSNVHVVHALLQAGCPLPVYADGSNILHTLASLPHTSALADELVSAGADLNQATHTTGETPLSSALRHRNLDVAAALIRLGARIDDTCAAALFQSSDHSPVNPQHIPALITLLHANGWEADDRAWRLFLSEYLATPRPSTDLPESTEASDLNILQSLVDASDGKVPANAAALLPMPSPILPAPHMTRLMGRLLQLGASANCNASQDGEHSPLSLAVTADELLVRVLLAAGADANAKLPPDGITALHLAASVDIARTLLVAGADVRAADASCPIISYLVAHPRAGQDLVSLCQFWAIHGASVNASAIASVHPDVPPDAYVNLIRFLGGPAGVNVRLSDGRTPLHYAVNSPARVRALIQAGAHVNVSDSNGITPLHIASDPESVLLLARAGANVAAMDHAGLTPLHHALEDPSRVEALIRAGADVNATDAQGRRLLELTTNVNTLRLLTQAGADVNAKDFAGKTLLHRLVNSPAHVAALLQVGAAVTAVDANGRTPLHLASNPDSIRLLVQAGAELNAPDDRGLSPLHLAANSPERVDALIQAGADVNNADRSGRTPLHITTSARAVELLVQAGANVDAEDKSGNTPLMAHAAIDDPDDVSAVTALLDAGADTTILNQQGASALKIAHERPEQRHLIIELFAQRNIIDIVLDPRARDAQGRTALMLLVTDNRPHIPTIRRLLADGADINALDRRGYSALMHLILTCDNPELLSMLLDAGARIDLWGRDRKTPLSLAQELHRDASAKLLAEYNDSKFDYIISNVLPKVQFPESYRSFCDRNDYPLTYDTWSDPDALSSPGRFLVVISLSSQRGLFIIADRAAMDFPVCTGRGPRHATPTGFFRISQKDRYHRSNLYRSSMPFFMRLTNDGVGLHVGDVLRTPDSHGCVRMQHDTCQTLFNLLPLGTEVVIRE